MMINEIFASIQGESTLVGLPTTFVRLAGCNLRCNFCDSQYAYGQGKEMTVREVVNEVQSIAPSRYVCITGGEPLIQYNEVMELCEKLSGFFISVETNGSIKIDQAVNVSKFVMDVKGPSARLEMPGAYRKRVEENILRLDSQDELKFVVADKEDLENMLSYLPMIPQALPILVSPVFGQMNLQELAEWLIEEGPAGRVRLQCQLHKIIWDPEERGV